MQQSDVNAGSVQSVLTVNTESPKGPIEDGYDVFVTLEPVSSIELGETMNSATGPANG